MEDNKDWGGIALCGLLNDVIAKITLGGYTFSNLGTKDKYPLLMFN